MFKDENISAQHFVQKFIELKSKLDESDTVSLDLEYYRELKIYIDRLYAQLILSESTDDRVFDDIREAEMSNLNRLQKLKNSSSYKKSKHKNRAKNEDWG
ncbi:MAG: hypothetical protein U9R27_11240 [Campylobacterota bacterium]|nr:hypothetical protein [Campylobacterota bacterium]